MHVNDPRSTHSSSRLNDPRLYGRAAQGLAPSLAGVASSRGRQRRAGARLPREDAGGDRARRAGLRAVCARRDEPGRRDLARPDWPDWESCGSIWLLWAPWLARFVCLGRS